MRNLFRLRIEAPEAFQNQVYTFVDPGVEEGDVGIAILAEWSQRSVKEALEPILNGMTRHKETEPGEPAALGTSLEDLVDTLDDALQDLPEDLQTAYDLAIVMSCGRSLYILHSEGLEPRFSVGGPPQVLQSTLRVRVKELLPETSSESSTDGACRARMRLVRVFFEDEDRVVLWLAGRATASKDLHAASDGGEGPEMGGARIVVLKEPAPECDVLEDLESEWPELDSPPQRDRATMSYVALALVVILFATALFGMSRWQSIGHNLDPLANEQPFSGSVDSSLQPGVPSRVSSEVVEREDPSSVEAAQPEIQLARATPLEELPAETAKTARQPLQIAWAKRYKDWVTSSPRLVQGRVVYGCRDGHLYAVDPTGAAIWNYNSGGGIGATPEVDGTRIFCGNYNGRAFALRALDGLELWRNELGARIVATPAVSHQLAFFQTYAGEAIALDKKNGRLVWKQTLGGQLRSRPLLTRDEVLLISGDGDVHALKQSNGESIWKRAIGSGVISNPVRVGELVVFGSKDGHVNALAIKDGSFAWRVQTAGQVNSSPAIDKSQELLYIGSSDHRLYAIRAKTGEVVWSFRTQAAILSTPSVDDHKVYVTAYDRHTYVLDAKDGSLIGKIELGAPIYSSPMIHDGRVYFGSNDGTFYCLNEVEAE